MKDRDFMSIYHIAVKEVDITDDLYCIQAPEPGGDLLASIKSVGLLAPVYVQKKNNSLYRIVSGFRRVAAAHKLGMSAIPVFILEPDMPPLQALAIQVYDNLSIRPFKPSEVVTLLHKLAEMGSSREEIISAWLPRLGYGRNSRVYELYSALYRLEPIWLHALDQDQAALDFLAELAGAEQADRDAFAKIVQTLKPGKNNQREYWSLCRDVAGIENCTITELLQRPAITAIVGDTVLSPSQKGERFKQTLWELRYPHYMQARTRFQALIKKAKLPPDVQVMASPYFDDSSLTISMVCKNEADYQEKLALLQSLSGSGIMQELFGLVE